MNAVHVQAVKDNSAVSRHWATGNGLHSEVARLGMAATEAEARQRNAVLVEIDFTARSFGVSVDDILGERGTAHVSQARQAAMMLAADEGIPARIISEVMNRDLSTVSHGIRAARDRIETKDPIFTTRRNK